jgi:hypothetical protein
MNSDTLLKTIKEKVKSKNPNISNKELDSAVESILTKYNSNKKVDEDGHIVVAENVKVILSGAISTVTEVKE